MKASSVYNLSQDKGVNVVSGYATELVHEHDYGNMGVFAIVSKSIAYFPRLKVAKTYCIEVYELDSENYPVMVHCQGYNNLKELKQAYKTFQY